MSETPSPTAIGRLDDGGLQIDWSDGVRRVYRIADLREACPCATCREKKSAPPPSPMQLTVLSAEEAQPLTLRGMRPVGSYAYNLAFSDGHDSGLFTLERLRGLGEDSAEA